MAKRTQRKKTGNSPADSRMTFWGRGTFAKPYLRRALLEPNSALIRGLTLSPELMARLPGLLDRILRQLDDDGQPITDKKKQYTAREQLRAVQLLTTILETNIKAALAERQGAMVVDKMQETEAIDAAAVSHPVVIYLPDNGRDPAITERLK